MKLLLLLLRNSDSPIKLVLYTMIPCFESHMIGLILNSSCLMEIDFVPVTNITPISRIC